MEVLRWVTAKYPQWGYLSFSILPNSGLATYSGGTDETNNPYQIATANDLLTLAAESSYGARRNPIRSGVSPSRIGKVMVTVFERVSK